MAVLGGGCPVDDDDDDTTAVDDDSGDDDSVDIPYLRYEFALDVDGDSAEALLTVDVLDEQRALICTYPIGLAGVASAVPDQGGPFWDGLDRSVVFTEAWDPGTTDCGPEYGKPYHDGPEDVIANWSPLGFVSCERAGDDPTFLGDDPTGVGDGSFASYCSDTAPAVAGARPDLALGPVEGIWLGLADEGVLDAFGDYVYPPSADGSGAWYLMGLLYATEDNATEPAEGWQGPYRSVALWLLIPY